MMNFTESRNASEDIRMASLKPFFRTLHNHGLKPTHAPIVNLTPEGFFKGITPPVKAFDVVHTSRNGTPTTRLEPTPLLVDTFKKVVVLGETGALGHGLAGVKAIFLQGHNKGKVYEDSTLFRFYTGLVKRVEQAMPPEEKNFQQVHTPFTTWDTKPLKTSTSMHHDGYCNSVALHYGEQHGMLETTGLPVVQIPSTPGLKNFFSLKKHELKYVALEPRHNNDAFGLYHNSKCYGTPHGAVTPVANDDAVSWKLSEMEDYFRPSINDSDLTFTEFQQRRSDYFSALSETAKRAGLERKLVRYEPERSTTHSQKKIPTGKQMKDQQPESPDAVLLTPDYYKAFHNPYKRKDL
jgi:hypothetical protein